VDTNKRFVDFVCRRPGPDSHARRVSVVSILAVTVLGALLMNAGVSAAATPPPVTKAGDISIAPEHPSKESPSYFTLRVKAGSTVTDGIIIANHSDAPINLVISPVDGVTGQTSGSVYANRQDPVRKAGQWVTPSLTSLDLQPQTQRTITFAVKVPVGASAGDHLAGVAVENTVPTSSSNGFAIRQILRNVIGVRVIVPGPATCKPSLTSLGIGQIGLTGIGAVNVTLGNAGTQLAKPRLTVALIGPNAYHKRLSRDLDTVLPGDTITYPFAWPDKLVKGSYDVTATMTCSNTSVTLHSKVELGAALKGVAPSKADAVIAVPKGGLAWWAWALIGLGVLGAFGFILMMVIRYERRRHASRKA
jgi:hypothetical protein